jgi:hypothetical protein
MAGAREAMSAASAVDVNGLRSAAAPARTAARPDEETFSGRPTIAYSSGRPSHEVAKVPLVTRELTASTAAMY